MSSHSGPKTNENYESWDSLFRKTLSKERLFTFTRPSDNPIHWIHFLDPFDQQDTHKISKSTMTRLADNENTPRRERVSGDKMSQLKFSEAVVALAQAAAKPLGESLGGGSMDVPIWPLIPFSKVQLFKCEKCCMEFCSPMNHRRHLRMIHRRPLHTEKEDLKSQRQQLATFWDNLSPEEAYEIVAIKNLAVEDLTGERVVRALTQLLQQSSLFSLPHTYVKAGAMLLELVQKRSSRLLSTSSELFKILDGSSEKTFPSFGLNAMQRYIFEGEAGKVGVEAKNLVSSLGFLVEHNLVKAFIKDKDEEAWRCQTALVEEEEASQRKRAQIQARKQSKKGRQKDSKDKERKPSESATRLLSDSDTSDGGVSSSSESAFGYGLQLRPSSNTFENLYDRLADEGSDSDHHREVVSTAVSSPCENDLVQGNPDDMVTMGDEACTATGDGVKHALNFPATNEGSSADASGFQKPYNYTKRKYSVDRSLSFRGRVLLLPYQKVSWKKRNSLSTRNYSKQIGTSNLEVDTGSENPCCSLTDVEHVSVGNVAGFRPRQCWAKPVRVRNYQTAPRTRAAIWMRKVPERIDAALDKISDCVDMVNCSSPDIADPVQADGRSDSSAGVSASILHDKNAVPPGRSACSLSDPSTTGVDSLPFTRGESGSNQQVDVAASNCQSDNPCQAGHNPAPIASVVIGSVCLSLIDSTVGQEKSTRTLSFCKDETEARKEVEASARGVVELPNPAGRTKESFGALHENGVINCVSQKELEGGGKSLKIHPQLDPEGKENNAHSEAGKRSFTRSITVQSGNFKGPRLKVWRPIISHTSHDRVVENVSALGSNSPDSLNMVLSNESTVVGREVNNLNNHNLKELDLGQTIQEDGCLVNLVDETTSAEETRSNVVEEESTMTSSKFRSGCPLMIEAVACFLSQRWSDAIKCSDSVIFSVTDDQVCTRSSENIGDLQIKGVSAYPKDSGNPLPQTEKDAYHLSGNAKKIRGLWKQGCTGSATAAHRRLTGKDNLHSTSRFTGYRYVPK
eukprot:c25235_g1_i1 orf=658-3729(-)